MLFTGFGLFLITGILKYQEAVASGPYVTQLAALATEAPTPDDPAGAWEKALLLTERFMPYLSTAYLIILLFLFARLCNAWLYTRDLRRNGLTPLQETWTAELKRMASEMGLHRVCIFLSDRVTVPVTLGFLKPIILLPVAALNYLTPEQAQAVLLHEFAHIRRRDYLVNLAVSVAGTLLFFNPFAQALSASLRRDRELCCDDFVLHCRQDPADYVQALMNLEQNRSGLTPAMVMAATGTRGQLLIRVKRILDVRSSRMDYSQRMMAFLVIAGLLSALAWINPNANVRLRSTPMADGKKLGGLLLVPNRPKPSEGQRTPEPRSTAEPKLPSGPGSFPFAAEKESDAADITSELEGLDGQLSPAELLDRPIAPARLSPPRRPFPGEDTRPEAPPEPFVSFSPFKGSQEFSFDDAVAPPSPDLRALEEKFRQAMVVDVPEKAIDLQQKQFELKRLQELLQLKIEKINRSVPRKKGWAEEMNRELIRAWERSARDLSQVVETDPLRIIAGLNLQGVNANEGNRKGMQSPLGRNGKILLHPYAGKKTPLAAAESAGLSPFIFIQDEESDAVQDDQTEGHASGEPRVITYRSDANQGRQARPDGKTIRIVVDRSPVRYEIEVRRK
jgi:beta-lactamase regulating signal transducer with metallopeptidase domain